MSSKKLLTPKQIAERWSNADMVAGVDEVGRGPLMGPVVCAAVILDERRPIAGLADSKTLSEKKREQLYGIIMSQSLCVAVAQASVEEIDRLNILQATLLAMQRAVQGLRLSPHMVLVDGNKTPQLVYPVHAVVKGDSLIPAIAAASVIAKVTRDRWCRAIHEIYPQYGFDRHKGYGTQAHMAALEALGPCPFHRLSFQPVRDAAALRSTPVRCL